VSGRYKINMTTLVRILSSRLCLFLLEVFPTLRAKHLDVLHKNEHNTSYINAGVTLILKQRIKV